MPNLISIIQAPKGLLNKVPTGLPIFNELPTFSIAPKTFGTGAGLDDESTFNKNKTGGHFGDGFFHTHYSGQVSSWMNSLGKNSPNGVQTFTNAELNNLVDTYIVGQAPTIAKYIIVDFEPSNPTLTSWMWKYSDSNFQATMNYIANRVFTVHNKYFYDWITLGFTFTYNRENYGLDGSNNDGFANSVSTTNTNTAANLLEIHRNPTGITRLKSGIVNKVGIGYTAITYNPLVNINGMLPNTQWRGVENMVLKHICNLALKHKIEPNKPIIGYFWPLEDKPVGTPGRRSNIYTKFKPNSITSNYPQNLTGKVKYNDNRLTYPSNIIEDTVLYTLSYPNLLHNEYWLHGSSYNPYAQIRYSSVNGAATSCMGGSFRTGNYQGSESLLPCPSNLGNYISTEAPTVSAFIKAPYRHAISDIKNILNGTQIKEFYQFQYKRHGQSVFTTSVFENNTGGSCLAALHSQPVLEVWINPTSGSRVIYFWDLFADAFAPTEFKFTIGSTEYTGTTVGNRLFPAIILGSGPISTTTNNITTTTATPTTTTGGGGGGSLTKELIFVVNLTGGGFSLNNPSNNYISSSQLQLVTDALTGPDNEVVDSIRMPFRWGDYNPSPGVYRNAEMTHAINWVRNLRPSNPPQIDLMIIPILLGNDTRIPANELSVDNNGNLQDCIYNYAFTTVPSYNSAAMTAILDTGYNQLIPYLTANHNGQIRIMELAAGQSEEHYMPFTANNPTSGPKCGVAYSGIGDYSNSSKLAWRVWLGAKYGSGNIPYLINGQQYTASNAQLPNVGVTVGNNYGMNYSQPAYRDLFRFYSKTIFNIWKRFHDKVKALSNFKTGYFIPDMLNEQGTKWIFHGGTIFEAMKYADQFYHTHNISPNFWQANLWGTDTLLGTFPNQGKLSGIEYDEFDAGATGGGNPNNNHVKQSMLTFIKNGGKVVHTALAWNTGQVNQWKALIKDVKNTIANPSWTLNSRTGIPTVTVDTSQIFNNPGIYEQAWKSVGGNNVISNPQSYNAAPVNIVIQNNGTIDNFYL